MTTPSKNAAPDGEQSDSKAVDPGPVQDSSEDPTAFILSRARSEVHLLLDNISANPDVTIAALTAQTKPKGLPKDWIEKVCEITWPPKEPGADPDELAKQAALLIKTRDYLNGLAKPASGATIAFTLMVTQETDSKPRRRRRPEGSSVRTPSRTSLAEEAYPDMVERARNFRFLLSWTLIFSVGALLVTLLISWYLTVGNAALADFAGSRAALLEADLRVGTAQSALNADRGQPQVVTQPVTPPAAQAALNSGRAQPRGAAQASTQPAPRVLPETASQRRRPPPNQLLLPTPLVDGYLLYPCAARVRSYPSAELRDACLARKQQADRFLEVRQGLDTWAIGAEPETAGWLATLLGSAVLPVLYGFLGAIASVVRTLSRKIKANLLSPRDVQLTFQQLALGAVVGACISLFIAAPGGGNGDTSLLGPVALSSSAVAFVAGFGVESVFQALEALIARIFNVAPPAAAARRETRPGP